MIKRGWLGVFAVAGVAGAVVASSRGAEASDSVAEARHSSANAKTPLPASCFETDVVEGQSYRGPAPNSFPTCDLQHPDRTHEAYATPTFVVRLKDCRNAIYCSANGPVRCDGYMLPFPTAWISDENNAGCLDTQGNCKSDPGPFHFERALQAHVNGIVPHQFLVKHVTYSGDPKLPYKIGASRFYNGTLDTTQLDPLASVANDPQWTTTYHDVTPHARTCTYVLQYNASTHQLEYSGFHSPVGEGHDPIDWPN